MAEWIDGAIEEGLAVDGAVEVTAANRQGPRRVEQDGSTYLLHNRAGGFKLRPISELS